MIKKVRVEDAVGMELAHDMTKVVPGEYKGARFQRGHVLQEEDIAELRQMGKDHVYVMRLEPGEVHEEEASLRVAQALCGEGLEPARPHEGRVDLRAKTLGLVKVNVPLLRQVNLLGEFGIATQYTNTVLRPGEAAAAVKVVPLVVNEERIRAVEELCAGQEAALRLVPIPPRRAGVLITGTEVYEGRIRDGFGDLMVAKLGALGAQMVEKRFAPDDVAFIARELENLRSEGVELIVTCGGLAVDADDVTAEGVQAAGATVLSYGAPVVPGSLALLADWDGLPVLGVPAGALFSPVTAFDLLLPRVLAGERLTRADMAELGHGGMLPASPRPAGEAPKDRKEAGKS